LALTPCAKWVLITIVKSLCVCPQDWGILLLTQHIKRKTSKMYHSTSATKLFCWNLLTLQFSSEKWMYQHGCDNPMNVMPELPFKYLKWTVWQLLSNCIKLNFLVWVLISNPPSLACFKSKSFKSPKSSLLQTQELQIPESSLLQIQTQELQILSLAWMDCKTANIKIWFGINSSLESPLYFCPWSSSSSSA